MKKLIQLLPVLALAFCCSLAAHAQAPAGAPAGSTGQCNDGTYSTASMKMGACHGHKGVKTWWGATKAAAAPAKTASTPAPAAAPAAADKHIANVKYSAATATAASGGGPGMVWVNTSTKVYHCPGDRYYGKTKAGSYMTEAAAKSAGYKADANKPCTK